MTEEQVKAFRKTQRETVIALTHLLVDNADALCDLTVKRAVTIGVEQYGDTSYHKTNPILNVDVREELADALFYLHIIINRKHESEGNK